MLMDGSLHCKIYNENIKLKMSQRLDSAMAGLLFEPIDDTLLNRLAERMGVGRNDIEVHGDNITVNYKLKPDVNEMVVTAVIMQDGSTIEFEPAPR